MGDIKHVKNFSYWEFACPCCGMSNPAPWHVERLQLVRDKCSLLLGRDCPMNINSGCRCVRHNRTIPGSSETTQHLYGLASDVWMGVRRSNGGRDVLVTPRKLYVLCKDMNIFTGLIEYNTFLHLDNRVITPYYKPRV